MKRVLSLILLCFLVGACSSDIDENRETRSTVYKGQSTWDMYENFGAPSYAIRLSPEEVHFIYRKEEVTRDWTKMYFDWCDKIFVTVNDYIVDWEVNGNQCYLNVADPVEVPSEDNPRENIFERYYKNHQPEPGEYDEYPEMFFDSEPQESYFSSSGDDETLF